VTELSSARNPRVKAAAALRDRKERDRTGLTLVDGIREVTRAVAAGAVPSEAFVHPERLARHPDGPALDTLLRASGAPVHQCGDAVLDRLGFGDRSEGIVAVVPIPPLDLERLALPPEPLVVVLEGVEKPGNLGAVLRSADGAGADAVILADPRTDPFNPNAIRASLGTIFAVPLAAGPSEAVRDFLRERRIAAVTARVDAPSLHTAVDLRGALALVLGSEAHGLSEVWRGDDTPAVRLPMLGVADSLNVATAAAVLLYEARRQRDGPVDEHRRGAT